jgi:hypothetical protein
VFVRGCLFQPWSYLCHYYQHIDSVPLILKFGNYECEASKNKVDVLQIIFIESTATEFETTTNS